MQLRWEIDQNYNLLLDLPNTKGFVMAFLFTHLAQNYCLLVLYAIRRTPNQTTSRPLANQEHSNGGKKVSFVLKNIAWAGKIDRGIHCFHDLHMNI